MATKKYVSLDKLTKYDDLLKAKIKTDDEATLASAKAYAKEYADGLATNYDEAGAAATAESNAQSYTDGKITEVNGTIAGVKTIAEQGVTDAATADGKAVKAQGDVDNLKAYVGTFTASEGVDTVVKYIDAKTAHVASDETVNALTDRVSAVEGDVAIIKGDYLKSSDKTELSNAVNTEKERAMGIENGLRTDVDAIKGDYLKSSDKTELSDLITAEANRAKGVEGGLDTRVKAIEDDYLTSSDKDALQNQINLIMNNPDTKDVIDSIAEFTQYIADHGEIAEGFRTDIDKNKEDIAANAKAIADQAISDAATYATKTDLANEKKALQEEIDADVKVVADKVASLEGASATHATKDYVDGQVQALQGVDSGLDTRLQAVEAKFGEGDGNVAGMIATAKQEAIDAAAGDATSKANTAESNAKGHADSLNTAMNTRVEALEAIDHDHSNKGVIDGITSAKVTAWDNAAAKVHEHSNKTVLDGITSAKVTAWDNAEGNAKNYADGLNSTMDGRVATLEAWHTNFVECSETDINNLFL